MTTAAAAKKAEAAGETKAPDASHDARTTTGRRPRVSGTLAKPIYLIHDGKYEVTVPAVTREFIDDDEDSKTYGELQHETVVEEYVSKGALPKNSRYGIRKIGVAHEITSEQEAEDLKRKGFRVATAAEIENSAKASRRSGGKSIDEIAAEQRLLAQKNFKRMSRGSRSRDEDAE